MGRRINILKSHKCCNITTLAWQNMLKSGKKGVNNAQETNESLIQQLRLNCSTCLNEPWTRRRHADRLIAEPSPSGGYENVLTAIDVFSRYFFAYPLTDTSAINVAKVLIDIMTKHSYLPTTLITDKRTAFTSTIIAEITQILGITLKCATTKHPQTIGKLERTHASLGCEPTRVFQGRILYNDLDHKLGNNPNDQINPTTEFAEEIQNRTKILIDKTKQNIMHSYIKYRENYDRKAKAAPLKENEYCFVLQPKADHQGSKIPFRDYRWIGPFIVQKFLPNENYIVRRINTNKTQTLHRFCLKKFDPINRFRTISENRDYSLMTKLSFRKMTCTKCFFICHTFELQ